MKVSATKNLLGFYFFFLILGFPFMNMMNLSEEIMNSAAYGMCILSLSAVLLTLLAREILGRDSTGFLKGSTKFMRGAVFVLSSLKFFLIAFLLYVGVHEMKMEPLPILMGALWGLVAFTLAGIGQWFVSRKWHIDAVV